jgi:riboflavin synthase
MAREELQLEAKRFTTVTALAKATAHLIEDEDCQVVIVVGEEELDRICDELLRRVNADRVRVLTLLED